MFLCYSHEDEVWKDRLRAHLAVLAEQGLLETWDDGAIEGGAEWRGQISAALERARVAVLLVSAHSLTSRFILDVELARLLERRAREGVPVLPVIVRACSWRQVPWLAAMQVRPRHDRALASFKGNQRDAELVKIAVEVLDLLRTPPSPSPPPPPPDRPPREGPGIASRELVFDGPGRLPGQEFALEVLTQPVLMRRDRHGVTVSINRNRVRLGIYSTEGKRELCRQALDSDDKVAAARRKDDEIHRFLLGRSEATELVLRLDDWPLRWASGGVFSVVRWKGRRWTPFFFRDIPPYGWNISLGGSEKGDDLSDPWTFLMREFLEETLVLDGEPRPARPLHFKRFILPKLDVHEEARKAEAFAARHLEARQYSDGLLIKPVPSDRLEERDPGVCTVLHPLPVDSAVEVERQGGATRRTPSLLCAVNLLELGIEMVLVASYALADGDYLLDGELLDLGGGPELVRMPMALIAHDYLAAAFAGDELSYKGTTEPSVEAPPIPEADIHLFPFDARRRREIVEGIEPRATPWERGRYGPWKEQFGESFFDGDGNVSAARVPALFTPTSAKIASYFFDAQRRG